MKYQFEVDEEITCCGECPIRQMHCEIDGITYDEYIYYFCRINNKPSLILDNKPDWCPLVKVADHTPILEKLRAELATLEHLQNNETDQERYETRRDAINYIKGKISTYEYTHDS